MPVDSCVLVYTKMGIAYVGIISWGEGILCWGDCLRKKDGQRRDVSSGGEEDFSTRSGHYIYWRGNVNRREGDLADS